MDGGGGRKDEEEKIVQRRQKSRKEEGVGIERRRSERPDRARGKKEESN